MFREITTKGIIFSVLRLKNASLTKYMEHSAGECLFGILWVLLALSVTHPDLPTAPVPRIPFCNPSVC